MELSGRSSSQPLLSHNLAGNMASSSVAPPAGYGVADADANRSAHDDIIIQPLPAVRKFHLSDFKLVRTLGTG